MLLPIEIDDLCPIFVSRDSFCKMIFNWLIERIRMRFSKCTCDGHVFTDIRRFSEIYFKAENHVTYLVILYLYSDRTGKKNVQYFLNTQQIFCGKVQMPCLHKQQRNIEVFYGTRCGFLHNLEQRLKVFARGCVENYSDHSNGSYITACYKK